MMFCILRAPGTNCDTETARSLEELGCGAEVVHLKRLLDGRVDILGYSGLVIPGGFSYGDHIRSGAIVGRVLSHTLGKRLSRFVDEGRPVLGICNGFQVLAEAGLLPGFEGLSPFPEMALSKNASSHFEDRWVHLRVEESPCPFTEGMPPFLRMPVAHGEGRVVLPPGSLERLEAEGQVVLRYALGSGERAMGRYPENPNGSIGDIAAIANPEGNVLGLMPHPERAFLRILYPDWTRTGGEGYGDGYLLLKNMVEYARRV